MKEKIHKILQKPIKVKQITGYSFLALLMLVVLVIATPMYMLGHQDGYFDKENDINKDKNIEVQQDLMQKPLDEVREVFGKYILIKTMVWLPWILGALLLGWILHGIL